jgi:hypothetical protein
LSVDARSRPVEASERGVVTRGADGTEAGELRTEEPEASGDTVADEPAEVDFDVGAGSGLGVEGAELVTAPFAAPPDPPAGYGSGAGPLAALA